MQPVENIIPPLIPPNLSHDSDILMQTSGIVGLMALFLLALPAKTERFGLSRRLDDLLRWMLWQTVSRPVSGRGVAGQFPDTEGLMQTGHHLCGPLCLLSVGSSVSRVSVSSFHLSRPPPSLHHGTSKRFNSPPLLHRDFLALRLPSVHVSLAVHLNWLALLLSPATPSTCPDECV